MFIKGLLIEARPRAFRYFHKSFRLQMFSVNFVLKNLVFFYLISFWVLYFASVYKLLAPIPLDCHKRGKSVSFWEIINNPNPPFYY